MDKKDKINATTLNEFKEVLKVFKVMLDDGSIKLEFTPFSSSTQIDATYLSEMLPSDLDEELFSKGAREISDLVNKILRDKEGRFLEKVPKKERKEVEQKCKLIEEDIITKKLIEKFLFHTNCKNYLLSDFDWEIIGHFGKGEEEPFSTVMVQLKVRNPSRETGSFPPKEEIKHISFECDKENIEKLIKELESAKEKLEK